MIRRGIWFALLPLLFGTLIVQGECGCAGVGGSECYTVFRENEVIGFSLTVGAEYFWCHPGSQTPLLLGWRVETLDGSIVREVSFGETPQGHWRTMTWDLTDDSGCPVSPGDYRLIIPTTVAGEIVTGVRIVSYCRPCCAPCWPCGPQIAVRPRPCPIPYGDPYIKIWSAETRSCLGRISICISVCAP